MARFNIDLTQVPKLQTLPDGTYIMRILSHKERTSQQGNPMLQFECAVLQPEEAVAHSPKHFMFLSLVENALFRVRELYEAVGKLSAGGFDPTDLYGCEVGVVLTVQDLGNGPRNSVAQFIPVNSTVPEVRGELPSAASEEAAATA